MKFDIPKLEKLLNQGKPIGTVFDIIILNPYLYADQESAQRIENDPESWQELADRLKRGYYEHLGGTFIAKKLLSLGFPESFIIKYVVYPKTYQFRTHLPFIDDIIPANIPKSTLYPGPIVEEFLGVTELRRGKLLLPVVRYAIPGGGTEFGETPEDICGTFYYPETNSDVFLLFNSCLIVPNKILAYKYLFNASVDDIAKIFLAKFDLEDELVFWGNKTCGFESYSLDWDFDERDTKFVYNIVKPNKSYPKIMALFENNAVSYNTSLYFEELNRVVNSDEDLEYIFRNESQDKDMLLFVIAYAKYTVIKMMFDNTWNWRVSVFHPYTSLDQDICFKAREMNIEVIVLTTENSVGMFSIKTEIVDTRSREDSYDNLRIRNDDSVLKLREFETVEMYESF